MLQPMVLNRPRLSLTLAAMLSGFVPVQLLVPKSHSDADEQSSKHHSHHQEVEMFRLEVGLQYLGVLHPGGEPWC